MLVSYLPAPNPHQCFCPFAKTHQSLYSAIFATTPTGDESYFPIEDQIKMLILDHKLIAIMNQAGFNATGLVGAQAVLQKLFHALTNTNESTLEYVNLSNL